ncbi:ImmA/IrrE family metallo-endopeptidase [Streptomyces sp. NEAU-NA10]|uniref:ImmA/IrrE family metallo-endopeptidase n=1 Tax=Streptomyces sp. NEAU-NA10 TaxID=3416050 RepID=UPI003CC58D14
MTFLDRARPLVVAHSGRPETRKRFTLGHELGHIELAWHTNMVECSPEATNVEMASNSFEIATLEREANEFASNLLVPPAWLKPATSGITHFDEDQVIEVLAHLAKAEVSATAGLIALSRTLLPGHAFFVGSSFSLSPGTPWPGERPLSLSARVRYLANAHSIIEVEHQGVRVTWAQMYSPVEAPLLSSNDTRTSTQILKDITARVISGYDSYSIIQSVSGVVGGLTKDVDRGWTAEAIAAVVAQRISRNEKLASLAADPEFGIFVLRKSAEVMSKRAQRTAFKNEI